MARGAVDPSCIKALRQRVRAEPTGLLSHGSRTCQRAGARNSPRTGVRNLRQKELALRLSSNLGVFLGKTCFALLESARTCTARAAHAGFGGPPWVGAASAPWGFGAQDFVDLHALPEACKVHATKMRGMTGEETSGDEGSKISSRRCQPCLVGRREPFSMDGL